VEHVVGHLRVVHHVVLDAVAEGGEQEVLLDALFVHLREARVAVAVLLGERLELAVAASVERTHVAFAATFLELLQPLMERARPRDRVERGVRHTGAELPAEHEVALLALRHPAHEPLHALVAVASEGILGLVVVVVGVEELEVHPKVLLLATAACASS
jgi:hypothetical protein